jgi:hypothetical protein
VELAEHVAGRERHFGQGSWVPGGDNDAPVGGVALDEANAVLELVHPAIPKQSEFYLLFFMWTFKFNIHYQQRRFGPDLK